MKVTLYMLQLDRPINKEPVDLICINGRLEKVVPYCDLDHDPWVATVRARLCEKDFVKYYELYDEAATRLMSVLSDIYPNLGLPIQVPMYISHPSDINKICSRITFYDLDVLGNLKDMCEKIIQKTQKEGKLCDDYALVIIPKED